MNTAKARALLLSAWCPAVRGTPSRYPLTVGMVMPAPDNSAAALTFAMGAVPFAACSMASATWRAIRSAALTVTPPPPASFTPVDLHTVRPSASFQQAYQHLPPFFFVIPAMVV